MSKIEKFGCDMACKVRKFCILLYCVRKLPYYIWAENGSNFRTQRSIFYIYIIYISIIYIYIYLYFSVIFEVSQTEINILHYTFLSSPKYLHEEWLNLCRNTLRNQYNIYIYKLNCLEIVCRAVHLY